MERSRPKRCGVSVGSDGHLAPVSGPFPEGSGPGTVLCGGREPESRGTSRRVGVRRVTPRCTQHPCHHGGRRRHVDATRPGPLLYTYYTVGIYCFRKGTTTVVATRVDDRTFCMITVVPRYTFSRSRGNAPETLGNAPATTALSQAAKIVPLLFFLKKILPTSTSMIPDGTNLGS